MSRRAESITALCGALLLSACGEAPRKSAAAPAGPPAVKVAKVVKQSVPLVMKFSGTVKPVKAIELIPRVGGFIEERSFVEGADLKAGELMYQIDPSTYQATLDEAQAALKKDQASLKLYDAELARFQQAGTSGAVSQEQIDETRARKDEAEAAVEEDQATIESAKLDLDFTKVKAPFDGRVDQTRIDIGELVTAYESVLTILTQLDPVYVIFEVSRADFYQVQRWMEEGVAKPELSDFEVYVTLPDGADYSRVGKLDFVSDTIDPTTDTLTTRAVFANPASAGGRHDLVPGQYVSVRVQLGARDALLIPRQAAIQIQTGFQVWVVDAQDTVSLRHVTLGPTHGDLRLVETGLEAGEQVVVEGVQKVRAGKQVASSPYEAPAKGGG